MGCALCLFYLAVEQDPKVQLDETLDRCLATLSFVRLLMNVSLKEDRWSWLVYNGTIYLYKMSRYLMTLGYSLQVIHLARRFNEDSRSCRFGSCRSWNILFGLRSARKCACPYYRFHTCRGDRRCTVQPVKHSMILECPQMAK